MFCRHEIVGVVTKVGSNVKKFKEGDKVGVGVLVDSCKECECCQQDLENYCSKHVFTYNSPYNGTRTHGGYSDFVVVHQRFVLLFPENLPLDAGAPLLCAGITVYSPMKYYGMTEPGKHLGVAGLGGLGHVAIKFGKAFGLKVTVISGSPNKEAEAIGKLGADSFLVSSDPEKMKVRYKTENVPGFDKFALCSIMQLHGKIYDIVIPQFGFSAVANMLCSIYYFCKYGIAGKVFVFLLIFYAGCYGNHGLYHRHNFCCSSPDSSDWSAEGEWEAGHCGFT